MHSILFIFIMLMAMPLALSAQQVEWLTFEEAFEKSKVEKKKIFIDIYTDWCGWCKVMDKNTFNNPEIAAYLNENFYPVKLDAEQEESIDVNGYTYKYVSDGRRGYNELAMALLQNKMSFPTVVFLNEDFEILSPLAGYHKPAFFKKVVSYFGDDHFKTTSWKDYEENYSE